MDTDLQAATGKASRLFFLDHLRVSLVILVAVHHVALVYGAAAPFYYFEPPFFTQPLAFRVLLVFVLVNQSFFMGLLFLLAGYFTPGSFERKGIGRFLKERLLRLGIPLAVFVFVLNPLSSIGYYQMPPTITGITTPLSWQEYPDLVGLGPLWFVAMLLVFSFGYAAWRGLARRRAPGVGGPSRLGYLGIGLFVLGLAAVSYFARMIVPLGKSVLDFPTLAYLPQYLSFFVLGTVAYRRNWLQSLRGAMGFAGLAAAVLAGFLLFPLAFSGRMFSLQITPALIQAFGGGHWRSAVYALWDSLFAVGMALVLITLFRRLGRRQGRFGRFLSQHSYTVYIIHVPTIVFLALAIRGIELPSLTKFAVATVIMVPACFAVAYGIRKIPGVSRIV